MGFLSTLFGDGGKKAAQIAAQTARETQAAIDRRIEQGQTAAIGALDETRPKSLAELDAGFGAARDDLGRARDRFSPYVEDGRRADGVYQDSLGLNGDDGRARSLDTFRAGPAYGWQVDQALDGVARKASALGTLAGGNTMAALSDRAEHMADQEFGAWQDRVKGIGDRGFAATGSLAGLDQAEAGYETRLGEDRSTVIGNDAARRAGVYSGNTGLGVQSLSKEGEQLIDASNAGFRAEYQSAKNKLDFGMSLGKLMAGFA